MDIDLELYRHEIRVSNDPLVRLSAIDLHPDDPNHTILFLHGFGGDARQWHYQLQEFSLNNRVIGLDMRGHGQSNAPHTAYNMQEIQSDLIAALNALGVKGRIVIAGHSFGGAVASQFAHDHPDRVEGLILIATSGEFDLNPVYKTLLKIPYWLIKVAVPFTKNWLGASPTVMKRWYENSVRDWNGWSLFRDIQVPTLVIRGSRDLVFGKHFFEDVPRAIPGAEDINVGASGHMVMLERRDAVNRAISRFLEAAPSSWRHKNQDSLRQHTRPSRSGRPWLAHYDEGVPSSICLPNIPLHHLLRSAVRRFPLRPAIFFEGGRMTYRRLNQEANRFANALRARGIDKGDRVMLLMPNLPQFIIAFYGIIKAGAVAVLSLPVTDDEELIRQVTDSGARILVTINQFSPLAQRALHETTLEHVVFSNTASYLPVFKRIALFFKPKLKKSLALNLERGLPVSLLSKMLYTHSRNNPDLHISPDDLAVIIYTGGTTSEPKGVMLSHRNLVANTLQTRHWMPEAQEGKERFLCVLPFAHSYGLTITLNTGIAVGATLIVQPKFETERVLQAIKKHQPTIFPGVPHMYVAISSFPGVRRYKVSSVQACISGSAPLPVEVQEAFEKLTRGKLVEGYGLTEAGPITHSNPLKGRRKVGSIGIPVPSTEAKIVSLNDPGKEMPVEQVGELAVRGPQIMSGYWNDEAATQKCLLPDGWLLTGDVAQQDPDGYYRIIARKADLWYPERTDEPAFPRDVEEVLYEIPQVKEAAVVGIAGQAIAFVIAKNTPPAEEDLIAYCRRRLPPNLVPKLVLFVEDFPRTFIGKVIRRELRKHYEQTHGT